MKLGMHEWSGEGSEGLANREMDVVALAEGEPHRQTGVNPDGSAGANVEITPGKVASDSGGLFVGQITRAFVWTEGRGRSAGKGTIVVIILLMRQVWGALQGCIQGGWGRELDIRGSCNKR